MILIAGQKGEESYGKSQSKVKTVCQSKMQKARAKEKAKAVEKAKGLEEAQRWPCKGWLAGKQRHENARSKCSNKCPDQQWKKIQRSLNSKSRSWQASCWTRTWTMEQTLIHWHCQQSLVSMLPVQESPPPSLEPCADPPSPHTGEGEPRPPAEEPCVDASRPHSVLGGAGVAHEETTVQAQPSNGTLPDPISGPRDSGMAQASSSSGSAPAQVLDDAAHRGQASQRAQRENNTPDFLSELDPPEDFRLRLSFNDHRFKAEIMTKQYVSSGGKKSCSKSFANDRSEWKQALAQVHRWAWTEWEKAKPERQLPPHCQPGTIPEAVLERLAPIIDAMSPPTKYAK